MYPSNPRYPVLAIRGDSDVPVVIRFKNFGKIPAQDIRVYAYTKVLAREAGFPRAEDARPFPKVPSLSTIGSDGTTTVNVPLHPRVAEIEGIIRQSQTLYISGWVEYRDEFSTSQDQPRQAPICGSYNPKWERFASCGEVGEPLRLHIPP